MLFHLQLSGAFLHYKTDCSILRTFIVIFGGVSIFYTLHSFLFLFFSFLVFHIAPFWLTVFAVSAVGVWFGSFSLISDFSFLSPTFRKTV